MKKTIRIIGLYILALFLFNACQDDVSSNTRIDAQPTYTNVSLRDINADLDTYEDRVTEIRLLVFDSNTGAMVYNKKLVFPGSDFTQTSEAVKLVKGLHDFYFIANETMGGTDFVAALNNVDNVFKFKSDSRFWSLSFDPNFKPTETSGFVMSSRYTMVDVPDGYTQTNPWPFRNVNTGNVQLVRAFAKVEMTVKNTLNADNSIHLSNKRINSVQLIQIPVKYSVPPVSATYTSLFSQPTDLTSSPIIQNPSFDYTKEIVGKLIFYIPEFLRGATEPDAGNTSIVLEGLGFPKTTVPLDHANFADYNQGFMRDLNTADLSAKSIIRNTNYQVNVILNDDYLQLTMNVMPWDLAQSQIEYRPYTEMAYLPLWNPDPPVVKQPYDATAGAVYDVATFNFKLVHPIGGIWKATLTNGLEFAFEPGSPTTGTSGIDYQIKVVALKPPTTTTRTTEFYLMINGEEVDPDNYIDGGTLVEGPMGIGPGNRYVITQSPQ
ncbi:MAG: fimbrial protein [Petrimonas sp.]|nr:fimbrial protein [Petrimonas sp.]